MTERQIARLTVIEYPDPRLRTKAAPVATVTETIRLVAERMLDLMREHKGVGLAAPQVGLSWRLFVCNLTGEPQDDQVYVNPRLTDLEGEIESEEGCLSIPGVTVTIRRAARASIVATDLDGRPVERTGTELPARCWQHEVDHLDGRLILDRMSEADRVATRKTLRQLETDFRRAHRPARRGG